MYSCPKCDFKVSSAWQMIAHYNDTKHDREARVYHAEKDYVFRGMKNE